MLLYQEIVQNGKLRDIVTLKYTENISFADVRKPVKPSIDPLKDSYATVTQIPHQSSRPLPPWAKKSDFQLTLGPRLSIWNIFQITAWHDWIHLIKSLQKIQILELHLQMKHLLHHKLLQNKKMKPQSQMLSLLCILQLQMMSTTMIMK